MRPIIDFRTQQGPGLLVTELWGPALAAVQAYLAYLPTPGHTTSGGLDAPGPSYHLGGGGTVVPCCGLRGRWTSRPRG